MKNSIEAIWKEGFLNERSLVAPRINDLYNQKSRHMVDSVKRMFRINQNVIVGTAIISPVIYYFLGAVWQGVAASILLLLTAWYGKRQMSSIKTLDHGVNSLEYLKAFDQWLKDVFSRSERVVRFSYPLYFLIAVSAIWTVWSKQENLVLKTHQQFPESIFIGNVPLFVVIIIGIFTLLAFWFSDKIFRMDVRLMYGRVLRKLKDTIAEMEKLKQD